MKMEMSVYRTIDINQDTIKMHGSYVNFTPRNEKELGIMKILTRYGIVVKRDITRNTDRNCFWIGSEKGSSAGSGIKIWDVTVPFLMKGINRLLSKGYISEEESGRVLCSIIYQVNTSRQAS